MGRKKGDGGLLKREKGTGWVMEGYQQELGYFQ